MKKIMLGILLAIVTLFVCYQLIDFTKFDLDNFSDTQQCLASSPDMVLIEGGMFTMGAGALYQEETPSVRTQVGSFYMSAHEVSNAEFAEFVKATGYVTTAEQAPDPSATSTSLNALKTTLR